MQWAALTLFTLLEDIDNPESGAAFADVCIVLRAIGRRWQLAKGALRLVQLTAKQMNIDLPAATKSFFRDFETELWKEDDRERFSSAYPNFAVSIKEKRDGVGEAELDNFLEKWDNLTLDDEAQASKTPETDRESPKS